MRRVSVHPGQLVLDLGDTPPQPGVVRPGEARSRTAPHGDGVFFAHLIEPSTAVRFGRLADTWRRQHELQGTICPMDVLHVSLNPVGIYERLTRDELAAAARAASTVDVARFDLTFDRIMSFRNGGNRPLVACCGDGVEAVSALYKAINAAMKDAGLMAGGRSSFTPHVTLLYDAKLVPEMALDEPVTLAVRDFVLVRSFHGRGRYKPLGHWMLRD